MLKKALFLLMVLLTVPNFASAYNYWTISAKSSPNIAGAVSISGADYSTSGSTVGVITAGVTTADFTVDPAPAGYTLAYVTIDGVKYAAPNNGATYRVNKGTRINHTLSAVYSVKKYSVTTSKSGNGYIDPTVLVASGSSKTVNITAGLGYKIGSVTAGGAVQTAGDGVNSAAYTFSNITENKAIAATFVAAPAVDAKIATSAQTIARGADLVIDGSASTSSVAASYDWSVLPATGATVIPAADGKTATLNASAAGTYTVQLTLTADAQTTDVATVIINVSTPAILASNTCSTCHATRDAANVAGYTASLHASNPYHAVSCQDCHTNGTDSMAVNDVTTLCVTCHTAPYAPEKHTAVSATCSDCHNVHALTDVAGTSAARHTITTTECAECHTAHDGGAVAPGHAQYVSSTVDCTNCHSDNVNANTAILVEFAESAHGNPAGEAWAHYDWRGASRAACQRCHNGTVFAAKLETLSDVTNYFGATPPVAAGETLNCSACHVNPATGELRAATNTFTVPFSNGASIEYTVPGASALCVRCHGGRESGDSVKLSAGDFANLGFINSHYLAAGGMVYNKIGYEFAGQTYDTLGYHKNVGKDDAFQTGTAGPCVACHMSAGEGHTWDFVAKDGNGVITANNSTLCASCHDVNMTAAALEEAKEAVHAGLTELQAALAAKGILFYNAYPYFYKDLNGNGVYDADTEAGSGNAFKNWDAVYLGLGKDVMGAAFNFNLVEHDPGAYAHNRAYALKLIADSIDFLDNGAIDASATSAAATQLAAANVFVAGTTGTGTSHSSIANTADCTACHANGVNPTVADITAAGSSCGTCHAGRQTSFNASVHFSASGANSANSCEFCHDGADHGVPPSCAQCHSAEVATAFENPARDCGTCHGSKYPHGLKTTAAAAQKTKCIECHSVALSHTGDYVKDNNNGVRAITTEFTKWSHHVTGVTLNDAHCAACHLEGKVEGGAVVVDPTKHMADAVTHLRNADTDADMQWNPAAPDHALMDNYCMTCHDADGAISAGSVAIQAFINANGLAAEGKVASATNPFGDTISNKYDKMLRPAVVDVKGQFDLTNPSHHAVMGPRYTGRTREEGAARSVNNATFAQNSSALLPGKRQTLYDAGKLNNTYTTLSPAPNTTDYSIGDDSVLHCGDCHTVGQWKAGSSVNADGTPTAAAIGAHGSENEYMLRNNIGTDEKHVGATYEHTEYNITNFGAPYLVCYNCHAFQVYGSVFGSSSKGHAGDYATDNSRCNGTNLTFAGYTTGTIVDQTYGGATPQTTPLNQSRLQKNGAGGGNVFAIQCAGCHNSGPANGFGGIHGSKVKTYVDGGGTEQKAYRFLPGLGNIKYAPGRAVSQNADDRNWEQKTLSTANREGCYTLTASTAGTAPGRLGNGNTINGAEIFGTWGACTDHGGSSVQGGTAPYRRIVRPVTY